MRFRAEQDFFSPELMSSYVTGQLYTVRPGNDKLAQLVVQWLREGKVSTQPGVPSAVIAGKAEVITPEPKSFLGRLFSWL
jgi:hypothetical protein